MSGINIKNDADKIEAIKRKVDRIYENYGIDSTGMEEGDLSRVYRYYCDRAEELERDYKESQSYSGKFDDNDIL